MNIFRSHPSPLISAVNLDDLRCGKMVVESGQLLVAGVRIILADMGYEDWEIELVLKEYGILTSKGTTWKITHQNHPASIWTRKSYGNYVWVALHGIALANEFEKRFDKPHNSKPVLIGLLSIGVNLLKEFMDSGETEPPQCMPDEYKNKDPHVAYRNYLRSKENVRWIRANPPSWW